MRSAILLFAHGARDPSWALPFQAIQNAVAQASPEKRVELAYLELMIPSLPDTAEKLIEEGVQSITIVPLFMAQGGHLKKDLPVLLDALRAQHPAVALTLTPAIGDVPELTSAIAQWVVTIAG